MVGEPELAGLLYRADWTRLSLSAGLTEVLGNGPGDMRLFAWRPGARVRHPPWMNVGQPPDGASEGPYRMTGRLLVAPGRRYRLELSGQDGHTLLEGCDGDRPWNQVSQPDDGSHIQMFGGPQPPEPELLHPSWLLSGFDLGRAEPTVAGGRDGYRVVATPRRSSHGPGEAAWPRTDRVEVIVDAELGILLRCEINSGGQVQRLSGLHDVVLDPPEAADPARFAPPPGSIISEGYAALFHGPGWQAGKAVGGLAAAGLAHMIRRARRHAPPTGPGEAIPQDEGDAAWAREPADGPPVGDDLVYRLYQAGATAPDFTAEFHEWFDPAVLMEKTRSAASASGRAACTR